MKQLVLQSRMYDRATSEYIQRFLACELTDHEAELFTEFVESIQARTDFFPFREKGWCNDDEELNLETPLVEHLVDEPEPTHRFMFTQDLYLEDTEKDECNRGWSGM